MALRAREAGSPDLPAPRPNLFFVYAVECEDGSHYIGQTDDLRRRWEEHQTGQGAQWTATHKAVRVAHYEEFDSREAAVHREKELKTGFGRKWLKEQASVRARQAGVAVARQRAENEHTDLQRTQKERMAGLDRLAIARHGPVRHVATALVVPLSQVAAGPGVRDLLDELDPEITRQSELAAEAVVIAYETSRGWECTRVGHEKIGFDIRSMGPPNPQTGYRDPVSGIRRIEVKGRQRGQTIRLTTNEWYNAVQLGDTYWLYVVWDPLGQPAPGEARQAGKPDATPLIIQNRAKHLDHAKREVVAARFFDIPAAAVEEAALKGMA